MKFGMKVPKTRTKIGQQRQAQFFVFGTHYDVITQKLQILALLTLN